jgi:transposase
MRPKGSADKLETRRRLGVSMLDEGLSLYRVGRFLGCPPTTVKRWRDAVRQRGELGLKAKPAPGRPPKLSARHLTRLVEILVKGPLAWGYPTDVWTTQRIAEVIAEAFKVCYHRDHVGRLLHGLKWSYQKPERRALQRNEEKIERWAKEEWPRIKKGPKTWVPTSSSLTNRASC